MPGPTSARGNSGRKCKTCLSSKRGVIDALLAAGKSDTQVSKDMAHQGVKISTSAIFRHRTICLGLKAPVARKTAPRQHQTDPESVNPEAAPLYIPVAEVIDRVTTGRAHAAVVELLQDAAIKMAAAVNHEVDRFIRGDGVAPIDSVRALSGIHAVLEKEAVVGHLEIDPDAGVTEKADAIVRSVVEGRLSPSNGERLLALLARRCELSEYQDMRDTLERMIREVESL